MRIRNTDIDTLKAVAQALVDNKVSADLIAMYNDIVTRYEKEFARLEVNKRMSTRKITEKRKANKWYGRSRKTVMLHFDTLLGKVLANEAKTNLQDSGDWDMLFTELSAMPTDIKEHYFNKIRDSVVQTPDELTEMKKKMGYQ